jgi:hypothetical protein
MKRVLAGLTAVAILTTALNAGGHRGGDRRGQENTNLSKTFKVGHHKQGGILSLVSQLTDLTTEQTTALQTILSDERTAMETLRNSRISSGLLSSFISEDGLERDAFLVSEAEFSSQRSAIKADTLESILATLTPEQILELKTLIEAEADATTTTTESNTTE